MEKGKGFLVPVLYGLEVGPGLVFEFGMGLGLLVESDVDIKKLLYAAFLYKLPVAPALICRDQLSELGAPVSKMVDPYAGVSEE